MVSINSIKEKKIIFLIFTFEAKFQTNDFLSITALKLRHKQNYFSKSIEYVISFKTFLKAFLNF